MNILNHFKDLKQLRRYLSALVVLTMISFIFFKNFKFSIFFYLGVATIFLNLLIIFPQLRLFKENAKKRPLLIYWYYIAVNILFGFLFGWVGFNSY